MHYLTFLSELHQLLQPHCYFEIGIREGASLTLSQCKSVGVDPSFNITRPLPPDTTLHRMTSDDFFLGPKAAMQFESNKPDLAFIDGWHNFEFALRDFFNTEAYMPNNGAIVFDDVLPRDVSEAVRTPHGGAWTGDVWKIVPCLQKYRPDLHLISVTTVPTGLLIVRKLDSSSRVLSRHYAEIVHAFVESDDTLMPPTAMRDHFVPPDEALHLLSTLQ